MKRRSALLAKYLDLYNKDPHSRVFAPLAETYRKLGMINEALSVLKDGIRKHPSYQLGHIVLANCYFDKADYERSYQILSPLIEFDRSNIVLQRLFGDCCLKLGYTEQALETFKYLLLVNARDKYAADIVKKLEDDLYLQQGKTQRSVELIKDVDESSEEEWVAVDFNHGDTQIDLSSDDLEKQNVTTIETKNEDPFFTHTIIDIYCKQGHRDKAIDILEKIIELNPNDERSLKKLQEIKAHINNATDGPLVESESENEAHNKLLNLIDNKVKKKSQVDQEDAYLIFLESFLRSIKEKSEHKSL